MITEIGSRLRITNPSPDMVDWCKKHLEIPNPEYQKKARMNLWLGDTPRTLVMYEVDGDSVIIPFGCLRSILPLLEGDVKKLFAKQVKVDYKGNFFLEQLAKTGAGEKYQLFGQIGLDHGAEWYHGKFTGISTTFEKPAYSRSVYVANAADIGKATA